MSADKKVLATMDCFHRYYRFCQADGLDAQAHSRFEAWLDYRRSILRRDGQRCSRCGQVRSLSHLDVRLRQPVTGPKRLAPDNLVAVCAYCEDSTDVMLWTKRQGRPV